MRAAAPVARKASEGDRGAVVVVVAGGVPPTSVGTVSGVSIRNVAIFMASSASSVRPRPDRAVALSIHASESLGSSSMALLAASSPLPASGGI